MIIHGDCLGEMRKMADNFISAIVTDPPYGLSFMGKGWDHMVPEVSYWKEALRISKPGAFLIAMGGTRTFHRLICAIEDAGWEIRDCLMWIYGSGFPKSHNHFGIEGYGTALKPAYEPIIMAMKPLEGTFKQNAEKWGQAGINIDGCRIATDELKPYSGGIHRGMMNDDAWEGKDHIKDAPKGRWPANVILDEEAGKVLDEQSGNLTSGRLDRSRISAQNKIYGKGPQEMTGIHEKSSGGASRFFYCAKASSKERGESNNHPTVKPLKLMEYLIKLVMPPKDGILLDPFAGSGTTILAAKRLGFKAVGIEQQAEYCEIANLRLAECLEINESLQNIT